MALDTNGYLLEGVRVATGNNIFTFPPRNLVSNTSDFANKSVRSEYIVFADSVNGTSFEIADPNLKFLWTRNESSVTRFDFDGFAKRWNTSPGGAPDVLGVFGNSPRLTASIPDLSDVSAVYRLYVGGQAKPTAFSIQIVSDSSSFGNPPAGFVQLSKLDGSLNFGTSDLSNPAYIGQKIFQSRQSFFDRTKSNGLIGQVSQSVILMNPQPAHGQMPRIRIGNRSYLTGIEVPTESSLGSPLPGSFSWSLDTGRVVLSPADVMIYTGENVYYDGVLLGSFSLPRTSIGSVSSFPVIGFTLPLNLASDVTSFVIFAEPFSSSRYYFNPIQINSLVSFPESPPNSGSIYVDSATGQVYFSPDDGLFIGSAPLFYITTTVPIENGVSIQFFRSGVNSSGISQAPDFVVRYSVTNQVIADGLTQSPFIMLPTVPLNDSSLKYSIVPSPNSNGTFTGQLVDAKDPSKLGTGFLVDYDKKQLSFTSRASIKVTTQKDSSMLKLPDAIITSGGLQIQKNGITIKPGIDFDFNASAGLLEFISPVGENDLNNVLGILGTFGTNTFNSTKSSFLPSHLGQSLFVSSGLNTGIYTISGVLNPSSVQISGIFPQPSITGSVDIRFGVEIVADKFWSDFQPPYKKFSLSRGASTFQVPVGVKDFSVFPTTGQVNINKPALSNEIFQISYISLDSTDNGVTVTPTSRTEFAAFKIRQEKALTTSGSPIIFVNQAGKTVDVSRSIKVYVDGITQDPKSVIFSAPGTIQLQANITTEIVTVDYFVREATGGETNFNLLFSPIDLDYPKISSSPSPSVFNGNQTSVLTSGSAILVDSKDLYVVSTSLYDSSSDITTVTFESTTVDSGAAKLQVTGIISGSFRIHETVPSDQFIKSTNSFTLTGNLTNSYKFGTVISIDNDSYLIQATKYDGTTNKTTLTTAAPARRNYLIPSINRTIRPILNLSSNFNTSKPAHLGYPFTLIKSGTSQIILRNAIDYVVSEGGSIYLQTDLKSGETLFALYVGRLSQPSGTVFNLNYAHVISPNDVNGLKTQRLLSSYNLYSPDTFYFRVESITSFLPEVVSEIQKTALSGTSGPNIQNRSSLKTKDFGSPSPYFDEQHLGNLDVVIVRMLKFYNDLANVYEDLLSNFDGRVVGGTSGKFRFDGILNNPPRTNYSQITNDIDDQIKLYDSVVVSSFSPISYDSVSINAPMWTPSNQSRLFSTSKIVTVALNSNIGSANFGNVLGSINQNNITSVSMFTTSRASSKVLSVDTTGKIFTINRNGDVKTLTPPFAVGANVRVYTRDGIPEVLGKIVGISGVGAGPYMVTLDTATNLPFHVVGSLLQETTDPTNILNRFYTPGRDLNVNNDNGQITNSTVNLPSLPNLQVPISGNELVDTTITFTNFDISPKRIPVLDGSTLTDAGKISYPQLSRINEIDYLNLENTALNAIGNGAIQVDGVTVLGVVGAIPAIGSTVRWINGPNSSQIVTVVAPVTSVSFTISTVISTDLSGSDYFINSITVDPAVFVKQQIALINTNSVGLPIPNSLILGNPIGLIGPVDSENKNASSISNLFGQILASGIGVVSGNTITDVTANFSSVNIDNLLFVSSGSNFGLYKVSSFTSTSITVSTTSPFTGFSSNTATSYAVMKPWAFLNPKEFAFISTFIQANNSYLNSLLSWQNSITQAGVNSRRSAIVTRLIQIQNFMNLIFGLLGKDDHIYDARFSWIQQRVDRKIGTLARKTQASSKRQETTTKLSTDQQRLLIVNQLLK